MKLFENDLYLAFVFQKFKIFREYGYILILDIFITRENILFT